MIRKGINIIVIILQDSMHWHNISTKDCKVPNIC
uniref:Uncharacterized protein n=1 Tax=Arundo donax TaxID=35708 RepID=A0A0A9TG21_ARUDO